MPMKILHCFHWQLILESLLICVDISGCFIPILLIILLLKYALAISDGFTGGRGGSTQKIQLQYTTTNNTTIAKKKKKKVISVFFSSKTLFL